MAVVVWHSSGLVMASIHRHGGGWSKPKPLSARGDHFNVSVAIDARGDIVVAWDTFVYARQITFVSGIRRVAGHGWDRAVRLSSSAYGADNEGASAAIGGGGQALVMWQRSSDDDDTSWIMISRRDRGARQWRPPAVVAGEQGYADPKLVMNGRGDALASWTDAQYEGVNPYVVAGFRPFGGVWHYRFFRHRHLGYTAANPALDPLSTAGLAWARADVRVSERPPGGSWEAPQVVSSAGQAGFPDIAMNRAGAMVLWSSSAQGPGPLWASYRPRGRGWKSPTDISGSFSVREDPSIAADARHGFVAAWVTGDRGQRRIAIATR
jgi:hypothetical protein